MAYTISLNIPSERYLRSIVSADQTQGRSGKIQSVFESDGFTYDLNFDSQSYQKLPIYADVELKIWIELSSQYQPLDQAVRYCLLLGMDMWDCEPGKIAAVCDFQAEMFVLKNRKISIYRNWLDCVGYMLNGRDHEILEQETH